MKNLFLLFFFWGMLHMANAQTRILDSLRTELTQASTREERKSVLLRILEQSYSMHPDSFDNAINQLRPIVLNGSPEYYRLKTFELLQLSKKGAYEKAMLLSDSLQTTFPKTAAYKKAWLSFMVVKAGMLVRTGHGAEAIKSTFEILEEAEEQHDTIMVLRSYILLGYALMEIDKFEEAIHWLQKGIAYTSDEKYLVQCGLLFSNIASCYNNTGKIDTAFYFIDKAISYGQRHQNFTVLTNSLNIRADMYLNKGNTAAAENDLKAALEIRNKIGEVIMIISDMGQLSSFYASTNQTEKGIATALQGIKIAKAYDNVSKELFLQECLAENLKKANRHAEYATTLERILALKDTLSNRNSDAAIAEMATKYEVAKKEKIILQKELDIQQSRNFLILTLIVLITASLIFFLAYKNYKTHEKMKLDKIVAEQKQLALIEVHHAQENERKRIAADLHDNLGSFAAAITHNVNELKQSAAGIDSKVALQLEENSRNVVTQLNDTIWVLKNERLELTKLADRFKSWLQKLMRNYPAVNYFYTENIEHDINFNPETILHVFMIMKECVTNALKHSNCSELKISVESTGTPQIVIEDNGKGMEMDNTVGNGIDNIKRRAEMSGWLVEWKSWQGQGTKVILSLGTTN